MNDDFFKFLVATDEVDDFLGYEPKCPVCGNKLDKIDINNLKYYCNVCKKSYSEDLKEYKDEKNKF